MNTVDSHRHTTVRAASAPQATLRTVDTTTSDLWTELLAGWRSDVFHAPAWHRVLADTYGFDVRGHVVVAADGRPVAGLATCRLDDVRGRRLVSLPFSDFCDPLVRSQADWQTLMGAVADEDLPLGLRTLRSDIPVSDGVAVAHGRSRWHAIDVAPSEEHIWSRLAPAARRAIRRAERDGVEVFRTTATEHVRTFFELHLGVRTKKYGLLAQPYRFFEAIHRHLLEPGDGTILLAQHRGEPIAGVMLLEWGDTVYYKFNASSATRLDVRPNDLLMWESIRYARSRGFRTLDLGLSSWHQTGLVAYKRKYATAEGEIHHLRYGPRSGDREQPARDQDLAALFGGLTALLAGDDVPASVQERAGDLLYRYFA